MRLHPFASIYNLNLKVRRPCHLPFYPARHPSDLSIFPETHLTIFPSFPGFPSRSSGSIPGETGLTEVHSNLFPGEAANDTYCSTVRAEWRAPGRVAEERREAGTACWNIATADDNGKGSRQWGGGGATSVDPAASGHAKQW